MSCLKNLLNKPVVLQIGDPVVAVHSAEEVTLEDVLDEHDEPIVCGRAVMTMQNVPMQHEGREVLQQQPVIVQVLRGEIIALSEDGLMFSTLGGDNLTPVLQYIPMHNVRSVSFAVEHIQSEPIDPPKIIAPN